MRFTQSWLAVGAIVVSMTLPNASWAKSSLDARVTRLENIIENELNITLINQLDAMQQEMRELRGKIEEQEYALQKTANAHTATAVAKVPAPSVTHSVTIEPALSAASGATVGSVGIAGIGAANGAVEAPEPLEKTEKTVYDQAYRFMNNKNYAQAIDVFKALLLEYPEGIYAPNAYYWLGEIYLAQWQNNKVDANLLLQSKESFNVVLNRYKSHHKAVDAMLKLGFIALDQENWSVARDLLTTVIKQNPGTSRARLAEAKLQRMQQEGH